MDYMPYEMSRMNNSSTLVIGRRRRRGYFSCLVGGFKECDSCGIESVDSVCCKTIWWEFSRKFVHRKDVQLSIDDGRRFISSTNTKYDTIVIKLVDSWAAQLAGGYALSENYLYTVEAFKQYLNHLNGVNGKLVMVRWST